MSPCPVDACNQEITQKATLLGSQPQSRHAGLSERPRGQAGVQGADYLPLPAGCWSWTRGRWQRAAALPSCWPRRACSIGWHRSQAWSEPYPSTFPPRQPGKTCHTLDIPVTWGSSAETRPFCSPGQGGKWQGKWTIITDPGGCSHLQGRPDQNPSCSQSGQWLSALAAHWTQLGTSSRAHTQAPQTNEIIYPVAGQWCVYFSKLTLLF